jgi:hypothetical protein
MRTSTDSLTLLRRPLNPIQLVDHVRWFADEVRAGRYP